MKLNEKHLLAFLDSDAQTVRESYLYKRGELNRAFQKRWFVLKGNLLFYYEKKTDTEPIGVIILDSYKVENSYDADVGMCAFDIVFRGSGSRVYTLAADSREEMKLWKKDILRASYDHMTLMVNDLQHQLDEINSSQVHSKRSEPLDQPTPPERSAPVASHTSSILRQSQAPSDQLIDISDSKPVRKVSRRRARINPFDLNSSAAFHDVISEVDGRASGSHCARAFIDMHQNFGDDIQSRCEFS